MDWNAIIAGILAVIGSYAGNVALTRKKAREDAIREAEREARQEEQMRRTEERMREIEKKLDEHNKYSEKLGTIAVSMAAMQKDIEYLRKEAK